MQYSQLNKEELIKLEAELWAEYKKLHGMQITDAVREAEVVKRNSALIENEDYKSYYISFLQHNMDLI